MSSWGVFIKEKSIGTCGVGTLGDRLEFAGDRLMQESDRMDSRFQLIPEGIPLREDAITQKKVGLLQQSFVIPEEDVKVRAFLGVHKENDLQTDKEVNAEERSDLQAFTSIPKDFDEAKQGWFADHEVRKFDYRRNTGRESVLEGEGSGDECNDANVNMEMERPYEDLKTGYKSHYRASSQAILAPLNAGEGSDPAMLIEEIPQSNPLGASPSGIGPPSSMNLFRTSFPNTTTTTTTIPTGSWSRHLDLNGCQKLAKVTTDGFVDGRYRHADNFLRETSSEDVRPVNGLFTGGEALPNNLDNSFHQPCLVEGSHLETYNDYTNLLDPSTGNVYTSHNEGLGGIESSEQEHKITVAEYSLRRVLSDSITGVLMDDAMVAQCGHSFGISSLQRVLETNLCLSCGTHVPPGSLIPNYALRAAVLAYKGRSRFG